MPVLHSEKNAWKPVEMSRWVCFALGGQLYGVDVLKVQEVLRMPEITPVSGAPAHVLGVINLRGAIVTVMDLRSRMSLPPQAATAASRVVVVDYDNLNVGLVVDRVADVMQLRAEEIAPAPNVGGGPSNKEVRGVVHRNGELVILLDLVQLLNASPGFAPPTQS
ncbi:MAG: chemotaxis protein CheW [Gammaproteobacteria bacterium]|nr:chemotaxis protein CheW [Gammaproteobacteria bacterium]